MQQQEEARTIVAPIDQEAVIAQEQVVPANVAPVHPSSPPGHVISTQAIAAIMDAEAKPDPKTERALPGPPKSQR